MLAAAAETHRVKQLPAYDLNSVLMEPQYYTKCLDGTTVILWFELTHHLIHKGKDKPAINTFSTCVVQICVILPLPGTAPATPQKKLLPHNTYFSSFTPTKHNQDNKDEKENEHPWKITR